MACVGQLMLFQITSGHSSGRLVVQTPVPLDRLDLLCHFVPVVWGMFHCTDLKGLSTWVVFALADLIVIHSEIKLQEKYKQRWRTSGAKVRMWFINKLAWDCHESVLMKFGFWSKLSWGNWTVETCSCSKCECWFVFSVLVAGRRMFWTEGTLCLQFWQRGWVLIASVSDADAQKAAVSIWLHLLIHNLDFWATHKICSLSAHSGVLLCKCQTSLGCLTDPCTAFLGR